MKGITAAFLILILAAASVPTEAAQTTIQGGAVPRSAVFEVGVPFYVADGPPGVPMDLSPLLKEGRVYIPVRSLGSALGIGDDRISWDGSSQIITIKGKDTTLEMRIRNTRVALDGGLGQIDSPPLLIEGRAFVPARYVANSLGYHVEWDDGNQAVVLWQKGTRRPDVSLAVDWLNGQPLQPVNPPNPATRPTWKVIGEFTQPQYIAVDGSGTVYLSDVKQVKKLADGAWTDITYNAGRYARSIEGVAVDGFGSVYLLDGGKVKRLAPGGSEWKDIGGGERFSGHCGIAVDRDGGVYVAMSIVPVRMGPGDDTYKEEKEIRRIKKLASGSSTWEDITGNLELAPGGILWGIAVDTSHNVYITEFGNFSPGRVKKLSNDTWTDITGKEFFLGPRGIAVDNTGTVYVSDSNNWKVKKLVSGSAAWTDITDNELICPFGIAVDCSGSVYVADLNNRVKKLVP
ncbi:MAG: hypothetical protein HPY50_12975 [Firmicutes bacterium]|nr:hypothetical protein [Bacillota bacterium]